ncbi:MAG: M48 family metallopeptidase [Rhodothermales bacterium]|nr:M48 family metallopeptidase [Rhodothermales bacterium]
MVTVLNRLHLLGAVALLALLAAGCATTGVNRGDVNLVSLQEEWALGNQLARDLARDLRLVNDPALVNYVNQMGQRIARQTELGNQRWTFHVVADPAINAFNIPGGHVYVNTGLIEAVDDAAELAGVMAHEIAHGVSRHGTERLTKAYGFNMGAGLLLGQNPAVYQQILGQVAAGGAFAKFSRNDEREADRLGVRYMYAAGYDPYGMAEVFEKLMQQKQRGRSAVGQFFATHPLTQERVVAARRAARQLPPRNGLITQESGLRSAKQYAARYH